MEWHKIEKQEGLDSGAGVRNSALGTGVDTTPPKLPPHPAAGTGDDGLPRIEVDGKALHSRIEDQPIIRCHPAQDRPTTGGAVGIAAPPQGVAHDWSPCPKRAASRRSPSSVQATHW